jgi:molybdate transport system ATP-binding protein
MIEVDVRLRRGGFMLDAAFASASRVLALHGASGSGKSTLALLIAGLLRPDDGRIALEETTLVDTRAGVWLAPHRRRIGVVFQDALLFNHLSVRHNMLFGRFFTPPAERRVPYEAVVDTLGVGPLLERRPVTLSGGERQRVGLARALLVSPRLLLMDEPMAALDHARRREIMTLIERLRDEFAIPIVLVSHAPEEILRLGDEAVILDNGRVRAQGAPAEILPGASRLIAGGRFALTNILNARFEAYDAAYGLTRLAHPAGEITIVAALAPAPSLLRVQIKATDITLARTCPSDVSIRTFLRGAVAKIDAGDGPLAFVTLALAGGETLVASVTRLAIDELHLAQGDDLFALVKSVALDERSL